MEDGNDKNEVREQQYREEIFSKAVRAGKRTYFFDVKSTRRNEYYLTITESKKRYNKEGQSFYEKHKIFLYREDFEKFREGLEESFTFIAENQPETEEVRTPQEVPEKEAAVETTEETPQETTPEATVEEVETTVPEDFTNIEFEDLEGKSE